MAGPPDGQSHRSVCAVQPITSSKPPLMRAATRGWLWFMDGALTDWLAHRDIERPQLLGLLLGTLMGAVTASGAADGAGRLS